MPDNLKWFALRFRIGVKPENEKQFLDFLHDYWLDIFNKEALQGMTIDEFCLQEIKEDYSYFDEIEKGDNRKV
jgi:hypothetical protein